MGTIEQRNEPEQPMQTALISTAAFLATGAAFAGLMIPVLAIGGFSTFGVVFAGVMGAMLSSMAAICAAA